MHKEFEDIELFQCVFQSSLEGILVFDSDGIIIKANPSSEQLFGYSTGELIGKNIETIISKKLNQISKKSNLNLTKEKQIFGFKKDGSQFSLDIHLTPKAINEKPVNILFLSNSYEPKSEKGVLVSSELRMAEAQRLSHIGDWYWNIQTNESNWSNEFYRIYGLPPNDERLNAKTVLDFIHPDDRESVMDIVNSAIKNKKPYQYKTRVLRQNGSIRDIITEGKVIYDSKGEPLEIYGTIQDVTQNRIMSSALDEVNRKFATLINNLHGIVFQCKDDRAWTMDYISESCYDLSGYTPEQFYNSEDISWGAIIHPKDRDNVWNKIQKAKVENQAFQIEYRIITSKNETKWVLESGIGIRNTNSNTYSFEGYIQDISAQKRNDDKLKVYQAQQKIYSEELEKEVATRTNELTTTVQKLVASNLSLEDQIIETRDAKNSALANKSLSSAIAQNFPNGFIIIFNRNFELLLVEGEAIKNLGLDKIVIEGITIDDIAIFSAEQKTIIKQDILKTIAGEPLSFEIDYKNKYFSVNTTALSYDNSIIPSALFIYSDVTELKRSESVAINALKKEQELNELKSRFVAMASHEFRTPLSAIQTSAILISKQSDVAKELKLEKYVAQIKRNVKHLVVILDDFLSLSRLEEGKLVANKELLDLVSFSKSLIKEVSAAKKPGRHIILSSTGESISYPLDSKLLRHIVSNLLSNAIKYSPKNTDIHFKIEESDQFVSIVIQDQGIGIPKEEQSKLFDRFFRAKNAQDIQGTGLGLNIVKQYVELMNGTIDFTSEINEGTTFLIKWPKSRK